MKKDTKDFIRDYLYGFTRGEEYLLGRRKTWLKFGLQSGFLIGTALFWTKHKALVVSAAAAYSLVRIGQSIFADELEFRERRKGKQDLADFFAKVAHAPPPPEGGFPPNTDPKDKLN